jgi:signal transduction histidine kinase/DNA-binding response OmpR family regulator
MMLLLVVISFFTDHLFYRRVYITNLLKTKMVKARILRKFVKQAVLFSIMLGAALCNSSSAQSIIIKLNADTISGKRTEYALTKSNWFFHNGDHIAWAQPLTSDSAWQRVLTNFGQGREISGWRGIGWFRLWVQGDTRLVSQDLGLRINHDGASEIYIDGLYRGGFGGVGRSKADTKAARAPFDIIPFRLPDTRPHLIAIRYANFDHVFPDFIGFQTWVGLNDRMAVAVKNNKRLFQAMYLSVAAQLALALLHLFLYLFYPKRKLNLYYVLFSVCFAGTNWAVATENLAGTAAMQLTAVLVFWITAILSTASGWYLLKKVGARPVPRWKIAAVILFMLIFLIKHIFFADMEPDLLFSLAFLIIMLDGLWALFGTIKREQPYVWLIGVGMAIILLLYFFVGADVFNLWANYALRCFTMSIGLLAFPVCFSFYLALDFARTNEDLSMRLAQVEELSEKALAQETEKLELITRQAEKLEKTVIERTAQVQRQADRLQELDQVKSRFFINLTHEFRTPLTLILGPAKQILSRKADQQTQADAETIGRNADRLLQLINQLLDLSKLEAGKMELNNTPVELVRMTRRNVLLFQSLAEQKQIRLAFTSAWDTLYLRLDQAKLEGILFNLLSNAIKFTESGGMIDVQLVKNGHDLDLLVTDTGIGIPEGKMPYIFDRFYQVDASDTRTQEGTGIGLALTKELTELMGGQLLVHSIAGEGTEMQVRLPIHELSPMVAGLIQDADAASVVQTAASGADDSNIHPLVLIIEDNFELRRFIASLMSGKYLVIEAANGEEGLAMALERIPDLVITDLMMPLMNGYEVCAGLKTNEKTSHIPVVILTAKSDTDSRIAGLETQADAYLSKPFDQRELLATVDNLIALRHQLQEKYSKGNIWLADTSAIPSKENIFLDKIRQVVEAHLDDEQYSVDRLGDEIGLSRTQLHRKLKALTGQGPGELIRAVRLQRALELLKQKAGTVAEVGYMVGFSNPNSFSTSFSKHFGFAPSEAAEH